jgi:hypothetical protein
VATPAFLEPADRQSRVQAAAFGGVVVAWLAYTRVYAALQASHLVLPACPFLALTGHPCPFCGGTRSFAATWRGDLNRAVHLYPAGPLLFVAAIVAAVGAGLCLLAGRRVRLPLSSRQSRVLVTVLGAGLAANWAAKLFWLGN